MEQHFDLEQTSKWDYPLRSHIWHKHQKIFSLLFYSQDVKVSELFSALYSKFANAETLWTQIDYKDQPATLAANTLAGFVIQITPSLYLDLSETNTDPTADKEDELLYYGVPVIYYDSDKVSETELLELLQWLKQFEYKDDKPKNCVVNLLTRNARGSFQLVGFDIQTPQFDLEMNYGAELAEKHNGIFESLNEENGKGIVLLHGRSGTGKTTYIKWLISQLNKPAIFIPAEYTDFIASPDFLPLMIANRNSILVIEDGERIIRTRESSSSNNGVHNLLNLTDGILGDCLHIQIIATFNTAKENIDSALLRSGRLIAEHYFDYLSKQQAQSLADSLELSLIIEEATPLCNLYNQSPLSSNSNKDNKIGFK